MTIVNETNWISSCVRNCERMIEKAMKDDVARNRVPDKEVIRRALARAGVRRAEYSAGGVTDGGRTDNEVGTLDVVDKVEAVLRRDRKRSCRDLASETGCTRLQIAGAVRRMIRAGFPVKRIERPAGVAGLSVEYEWKGGR